MKKIAALLTVLFLLTGCTAETEVNTSEDFSVITSFYPIYIFTSNIVKDVEGVSLQNLTNSTVGCLHDYSITPNDMKLMERADALVINGAGMEPFMDSVPKATTVIDSSEGIELLKDHGEANPHIWLSVKNAIRQVENITEGLCAADSIHADRYKKNAQEYIQKLTDLDGEIRTASEGAVKKNVITFHEAFPYFANEYGLNVLATVHVDAESEPSAAQLAEIVETVKSENVAAVFTEPQYSPKSAELIARETGVSLYELDPVATGEMKEDAYETAMRKNIETIKTALY